MFIHDVIGKHILNLFEKLNSYFTYFFTAGLGVVSGTISDTHITNPVTINHGIHNNILFSIQDGKLFFIDIEATNISSIFLTSLSICAILLKLYMDFTTFKNTIKTESSKETTEIDFEEVKSILNKEKN